jgi:ApaG protein
MTDEGCYQVLVNVKAGYLAEQSNPEDQRYVFAYTVTIENAGSEPARLLHRRWIIADANGKIQEVRGKGVVGEQPYLKPGESFRYTSGTVIETPIGSMHGCYEMRADDGTLFEAEIRPFSLATPGSLH